MERPSLSVADVIRAHVDEFLAERGAAVSPAQRRVLRDLAACRTSVLGGHIYKCDSCGEKRIGYNSCWNRHCPTCLGHRSAEWLEARVRELLPVEYSHVVFTVPEEIAALALGNKKVVYSLIFSAAAQTLKTIASNPRHLGAEIGFFAVLHTWSQTLQHHPHIHCVIPAGGLSPDGSRWIPSKPRFFLPVRVLSRLFRGKLLDGLKKAASTGQLRFGGSTKHLADPQTFTRWIASLYKQDWVVYCKPPFGSPEQTLKYLARYTHRVAISNQRLVSMDERRVTFRYRDGSRGDKTRTMTLDTSEFLRRFLLHVLPKRFVRIRYFGFLANCHRKKKLARCRELLGEIEVELPLDPDEDEAPDGDGDSATDRTKPGCRCPVCKTGRMVRIGSVGPHLESRWLELGSSWEDSS